MTIYLSRQLQIQRLDLNLAGGQVDAGNFLIICASHMQYLHNMLRGEMVCSDILIIMEISGGARAARHFRVKLHETVSFCMKVFGKLYKTPCEII